MQQKALVLTLVHFALALSWLASAELQARDRWTEQQANTWYADRPWLVGCNFSPSTAINQLEMWQADTFDVPTIDRELKWAADLGFNTVRVYLHDLVWKHDSRGYLERAETFLEIADKHGIGVLFVPLDGVWNPRPEYGKQPKPRPHVHNSGWVQSPGAEILGDPQRHDELRPYIVGFIGHFKDDPRIHGWDLFNEPDNPNRNSYGANGTGTELPNKAELAEQLLRKVFVWARQANPSQPLTAGVWIGPWPDPERLKPIERLMLEESDIISFHSYSGLEEVRQCVESLRRYNRPLLCTEYMARPAGSRFDPVLGYFQEQKVAAYNWGFVAGKTQTNYPWDSWQRTYSDEPDEWFHEILRPDASPYSDAEVHYIKGLTGKHAASTLVGRWDIDVFGSSGVFPSWLEIEKSGNATLVGRYVGQFGSARPVAKIETLGESFRFAIPPQWESRSDDQVFMGRVTSAGLVGVTTDAEGRELAWRAVRAPALKRQSMPTWGQPVALFNGRDLSGWKPLLEDVENGWVVRNGLLTNEKPGQNIATEAQFGDFKLHAEFRYPAGSNSGIYLRGRYEVQIEDAFGEEADSHRIGGIYGHLTPSTNASKKHGEWQTYDIELVGRKITVHLNGERVIDRATIPGITGGALDGHEGQPGPIYLQGDHGSIEFRALTISLPKS